MQVTGKLQPLPPPLIPPQPIQTEASQPCSRKQRRPLEPMQATPASLSSSVHRAPVSMLLLASGHETVHCNVNSGKAFRPSSNHVHVFSMHLCMVSQPSAVESLEYFLGGADDTAADRIAAWIPSRGDRRLS